MTANLPPQNVTDYARELTAQDAAVRLSEIKARTDALASEAKLEAVRTLLAAPLTVDLPTGAATATSQGTAQARLDLLASEAKSEAIRAQLASTLGAPSGALVRGERVLWRDDFYGTAIDATKWIESLGAGMTSTVLDSQWTLNSGITANSVGTLTSVQSFNLPLRVQVLFFISQRIANQEFYFEIVNGDGDVFARVKYDGTNSANAVAQNQNGGVSEGAAMVSGLIYSTATSSAHIVELELGVDEFNINDRNLNSSAAAGSRASRNQRIPDTGQPYFLRIRARNLGIAPASSTALAVDSVYLQDLNEIPVEVVGGRGNVAAAGGAIPVILPLGLGSGTRHGFFASHGIWYDDYSTAVNAAGAILPTTLLSRDVANTVAGTSFNGANTFGGLFRARTTADVGGTLYIEESRDNVTWRRVAASSAVQPDPTCVFTAFIEHKPSTRYARAVYVNGAAPTTHFSLQTMLLGTP